MSVPLPLFDLNEESPLEEHPDMMSNLLSISLSFNPHQFFNSVFENNVKYERRNPIYKTQTCTLYLGFFESEYCIIKSSSNIRLLKREFNNYNIIPKCFSIVRCHDFWVENKFGFLRLELVDGGSISSIIKNMSHNEALILFSHILYALNQIHSTGYVHLDISPHNILMTKIRGNSIYKLVDFGTVCLPEEFDTYSAGAGPYISPEALYYPNTEFSVSFPSDIWSFGAVMFEALTHTPVPRDTDSYSAIRNGTFDLSMIPKEFSFVVDMLNPNPNSRPTCRQLMQLPFVKEINETGSSLHISSPKVMPCLLKNNGNQRKRRVSFDLI